MAEKVDYDGSEQEKGFKTADGLDAGYEDARKHSVSRARQASMSESVIAADLLDERYLKTQRGLKSRHAQMIAFGGTVGKKL